jgi:hypothetical protein
LPLSVAVAVNQKQTTPLSPEGEFVEFYNGLTGRRLTVDAHAKFITPRLEEGASLTTLKLAVIGACLKPFHLGINDRHSEYLDPATILRPARFDGHAAFARTATWQIPDAETVWQWWAKGLGLGKRQVIERFFRARDELILSEGGRALGPSAAYGASTQEWSESA